MTKIKILPKDLVNKISAGEVVERPSSVVKELLENSIDSGADNIIIEVKEGGKSYIKIIDNGSGMEKDDLLLSIKEHATSKINSVEDLFSVSTLGFRGEALSSIASVSIMEISSRTSFNDIGYSLFVEGGIIKEEKEVGVPKGTSIIVKDIFFNTPARMKHLSSDRNELMHIIDIVERYSLSNINISLTLINDGKEIIKIPKTKELLNRIVDLYGKDIAKEMILVNYKDDFISISGYIGKPYIAKKDRSYQTLFVNDRYVKNNTISNALYDAYHTLLFLDRHPMAILSIKIDVKQTDVNVHPTKEIIRIEKDELLYKSVFEGLRKTLEKNNLIPEINISNQYNSRKPTKQYELVKETQKLLFENKINSIDNNINNDFKNNNLFSDKNNPHYDNLKKDNLLRKDLVENLNNSKDNNKRLFDYIILGQLNRLYIVCETENGLLLIDQHAAQERDFYEQFMEQFNNKGVEKQSLLQPIIKELSEKYFNIALENNDKFEKLGFIVEEYGNRTIRITSVPKIFTEIKNNLDFGILFDDILEEILLYNPKIVSDKIEDKIARKACKSSIKAGDILTIPQMKEIVKKLLISKDPYSCPHGRPTMINFSYGELEKRFNRTV
jgi:DNA mismatch repair protein MutL